VRTDKAGTAGHKSPHVQSVRKEGDAVKTATRRRFEIVRRTASRASTRPLLAPEQG
jgi:hypothetical protein